MYCNVHHQRQWMFGVDLHEGYAGPFTPHAVFGQLKAGIWGGVTGTSASNIIVDEENEVMQRGTDIGWGIPHATYPLNPLMLVYTLLSASKSEFAATHVRVNGAALAVAVFGSWGLNLNCGQVPLPSGVVIAWTTVQAWMTDRDVVAGVYAMLADAILQSVLSDAFDTDQLKGIFTKLEAPLARAMGPGDVQDAFMKAFGASSIASFFFGSPMGMSGTNIGVPVPNYGDMWGRFVSQSHDRIAGYYGDPEIEQYDPGDPTGPPSALPAPDGKR
jgi:hypothetical protein